MSNIFCDILNEVILKFVPKKLNKSRKVPVWMTKDAKKQRKNKVRMWKRYKEDKSYNNLVEYKLALNRAASSHKTAKANFESKLAMNIKTNPKAFYNYFRSKSKTKEKVGPFKDENGSVISNSNGMCKVLNNYFSSIFISENVEKIPEAKSVYKEDQGEKLQDIEITQSLIYEKLKMLKQNKAPGVDKFDSGFLNEVADVINYPLIKIDRKSVV